MSMGLSTSAIAVTRDRLSLPELIGPVLLPRRFALANPMNLIRILAGLYYLPHIYQKLSGIDSSLTFFGNAGLRPAPVFLALALVCEISAMVGLTFGVLVRWIGLASAGCLIVAAYAMFATKGLNWYWAKGGVEYLVFWSLISVAIAVDAWRREA